ncbi:MAG: radical SAM protein [Candidatus Omnitrophica bacterium]|nr:radical SAM protein [Candidatus Omnitrophota bacterium]
MLKRVLSKLRRPNHTGKRFGNACLVPGLPEQLFIEPTNLCDLKCPLCPTGSGKMGRDKGMMSFENFKKLIDEIAEYIYNITLSSFGEPFLNKEIIKMITYAKGKGVAVSILSNAQLIDRSCADGIAGSGLDRIYISLDGTTQESYEKYKVGGSLQKAIDAVNFIQKARADKGSVKPLIIVQFIIMNHNEAEIEEIKILAGRLKGDQLIFKMLFDLHGMPENLKEMENFFPSDPVYRIYKVEDGRVKLNIEMADMNFCPMAWNYPMVSWDGSLYPCCFDYKSFAVGNVFKFGFRKLWNGKKFMALRRNIARSKISLEACSKCPINFYDKMTWNVPL